MPIQGRKFMKTEDEIITIFRNYVCSNFKEACEELDNQANKLSGRFVEANVFLGVTRATLKKAAGPLIKDIKEIIDRLDRDINQIN